MSRFNFRWLYLHTIVCISLLCVVGPLTVLHELETAGEHHHEQACSICHLVTVSTPVIEGNALPAPSPIKPDGQIRVLTGYHFPAQALARSPPTTV